MKIKQNEARFDPYFRRYLNPWIIYLRQELNFNLFLWFVGPQVRQRRDGGGCLVRR